MIGVKYRRNKQIPALLLVLLLLTITGGVALAGTATTRIIAAGEVVEDDVTVLNDDLDVRAGAIINGNAVVFNGDAIVAGQITGDLVLFSGDLTLESGAVIGGDCVLLSGEQINRGEVGISCVTTGDWPAFAVPALPAIPAVPGAPAIPDFSTRQSPEQSTFGRMLTSVGNTLVIALLAAVVAALAPKHLQRISDAARNKPLASGTVGVLTAIGVPALMVLLVIVSALLIIVCIGLLGIPILILTALAYVTALVVGWIAIGKLLGDRLVELFRMDSASLLVRTLLGTVALTIIISFLNTFGIGEVVATLATIVIGAVGLGAVALTKFGTKPYPRLAELDPDKVSSVLDTLPPDAAESAQSSD